MDVHYRTECSVICKIYYNKNAFCEYKKELPKPPYIQTLKNYKKSKKIVNKVKGK